MKKIIIGGFMLLAWEYGFSQTVSTFKYPEQKAITKVLQTDKEINRITSDDSVFVPDHVTPDFHGIVPLIWDKQRNKIENKK